MAARGHLYMKVYVILVKKNDVIRVAFHNQTMHACTSFRDAKHAKLGRKGVFLAFFFYKLW